MHVELGARARTSDGHDAGTVEKLILDSTTAEMKAVVVGKGTLRHAHYEVPMDCLQSPNGDEIRLRYSSAELEHLPQFDAANYAAPPPRYTQPLSYRDGSV